MRAFIKKEMRNETGEGDDDTDKEERLPQTARQHHDTAGNQKDVSQFLCFLYRHIDTSIFVWRFCTAPQKFTKLLKLLCARTQDIIIVTHLHNFVNISLAI